MFFYSQIILLTAEEINAMDADTLVGLVRDINESIKHGEGTLLRYEERIKWNVVKGDMTIQRMTEVVDRTKAQKANLMSIRKIARKAMRNL